MLIYKGWLKDAPIKKTHKEDPSPKRLQVTSKYAQRRTIFRIDAQRCSKTLKWWPKYALKMSQWRPRDRDEMNKDAPRDDKDAQRHLNMPQKLPKYVPKTNFWLSFLKKVLETPRIMFLNRSRGWKDFMYVYMCVITLQAAISNRLLPILVYR